MICYEYSISGNDNMISMQIVITEQASMFVYAKRPGATNDCHHVILIGV